MIRKQYKLNIKAPRPQVWKTLWGKDTYPTWTAAFSEGSRVETTWEEGSRVLFLNAENEGMISRIEEKKEPEKMVFVHLGMIDKEGNEDMSSDKVKAWEGAEEIYVLKEIEDGTALTIEMDVADEYQEFFDTTWPKVFEDLRNLLENNETAKEEISVETTVRAPVEKVWLYWTTPQHITKWNQASPEWHTVAAENDLRTGGKFSSRMEAKDGSAGFDFEGIYDTVEPHRQLSYTLGDGRKVRVDFENAGEGTLVKEKFEAENSHSVEMQKTGWQAILEEFKNYVEKKEAVNS